MLRMTFSVVLAIALMQAPKPQGNVAATQSSGVTVYGYGVGTCGAWLEGRRTSGNNAVTLEVGERIAREQWVVGFVSGANESLRGALPKTDAYAIWAWVDRYCRENPLDQLATATSELVAELRTRK
jgi:hypothetical protein